MGETALTEQTRCALLLSLATFRIATVLSVGLVISLCECVFKKILFHLYVCVLLDKLFRLTYRNFVICWVILHLL